MVKDGGVSWDINSEISEILHLMSLNVIKKGKDNFYFSLPFGYFYFSFLK